MVWGSPGYQAVIDRFRPDAILCTQFLPAEVLATWRERSKLSIPIATAITDFAIHPVWVHRGMDRYFVATEAVREELEDTGLVAQERINVTGVPIDPKFSVPIPRGEACRLLNLDPDPSRVTVLIMGGGFGWGPLEGMLEVVLELPPSVQALVIAGRNERLQARLSELARGHEGRIKVHGFSDQVDLFMAASSLLVGKSGGLTSSEAMARGLPLVVYRPIPGQEERNCDYLQESGAAVRVHDLDELHYRLHHFVANPAHLARMEERARAIGRPRAAFDVARKVLEMAG
jgi:processive 1,2-diacylglycerol beta-glucosyltransferase